MHIIMPNTFKEEFKLISTHSTWVYACVLLHKTRLGVDGMYIKLRLRWLNNNFEIYHWSTVMIMAQYVEALNKACQYMVVLIMSATTLVDTIHVSCTIDLGMDELKGVD